MSDLITRVNAEIANNQLEEKVNNLRADLHSRLRMLQADWRSLNGKTIKESHTDYGSFTLLFTDGTYIVATGALDSEIMDISEGFEYDLLSEAEHEALVVAEEAAGHVKYKQSGETALTKAIAHLGIEAVKTLVERRVS